MKRFLSTIAETFLLLRRDKIFLPITVTMIGIITFANIVSYWGTQDYKKILYDIGMSGIDITGAFIAIFWGTKLIGDSKKEGSLELQLAAPVSRAHWVVGKFLGLSATLMFLSMTMIVVWQLFLIHHQMGWMESKHLIIFGYQVLGWIVLSALAVFFASLMAQTTAMFTGLCLWALGLMSANVAHTLHPETPEWAQNFVKKLAVLWDLQRFNLSEFASSETFIGKDELLWRGAYGLTAAILLVSIAAILFTKKDVASQ